MFERKEIWWCERCMLAGSISVEKTVSTVEVYRRLRAAHDEVSPSCPTENIHALKLEMVFEKFLPKWAARKIVPLLLDVS